MTLAALAVAFVLRTYSASAAPQLTFQLSSDATSFRLDAASWALLPSCSYKSGAWACNVALIGAEVDTTPHAVRAVAGANVSAPEYEANLRCVCDRLSVGGGCPDGLFPSPAPVTPTNLTATAVSSSAINLTWDTGPCNEIYVIERSTDWERPWLEIYRRTEP